MIDLNIKHLRLLTQQLCLRSQHCYKEQIWLIWMMQILYTCRGRRDKWSLPPPHLANAIFPSKLNNAKRKVSLNVPLSCTIRILAWKLALTIQSFFVSFIFNHFTRAYSITYARIRIMHDTSQVETTNTYSTCFKLRSEHTNKQTKHVPVSDKKISFACILNGLKDGVKAFLRMYNLVIIVEWLWARDWRMCYVRTLWCRQ